MPIRWMPVAICLLSELSIANAGTARLGKGYELTSSQQGVFRLRDVSRRWFATTTFTQNGKRQKPVLWQKPFSHIFRSATCMQLTPKDYTLGPSIQIAETEDGPLLRFDYQIGIRNPEDWRHPKVGGLAFEDRLIAMATELEAHYAVLATGISQQSIDRKTRLAADHGWELVMHWGYFELNQGNAGFVFVPRASEPLQVRARVKMKPGDKTSLLNVWGQKQIEVSLDSAP
jgi:hypothetical protein